MLKRPSGLAMCLVLGSGVLGSCGVLVAQAVPPPPAGRASAPTGTVSGRVVCGDNQRPARFAQVQLQSVDSMTASLTGTGGGGGDFRGGGGGSARTGVDGSFTTSVATGDYYVMATAPGYISQRTLLQAEVAAGTSAADALARLPIAHVVAEGDSTVTVTLERGGAISGRVQWEDASPAGGVTMSAVPVTTATTTTTTQGGFRGGIGGGQNSITTDDRGAFHLSGLPSGDYYLLATILGAAQGSFGRGGAISFNMPIRVYAPGVFHKADAKPITVHAGDDRDDVRMVLNLNSLHTVSGHVTSAQAGQNVASGRIYLRDASASADVQEVGSIDATGAFTVPYVPPGPYTLQVSGASTTPTNGYGRGRGDSSDAGASFQAFSTSVTVGDTDMSGMAISLVPVKTTP